MHQPLVESDKGLLGQVPFIGIELVVEFLLAFVQGHLGSAELLFNLGLQIEDFEISMKIVPDVFEKGVEVLLDDLKLRTDKVAPLDRHVVQGHVDVIQLG